MIIRQTYRLTLLTFALIGCALTFHASAGEEPAIQGEAQVKLRLPTFLASHMVLQRNAPITIHGWGEPGEQVAVTLGNEQATTKVDEEGRWELSLKPRKANAQAVELSVQSGDESIKLTDILIGDVWLGSGQSNMQAGLRGEHAKTAKHPQIRLFNASTSTKAIAKKDGNLDGTWKVCSPESVGGFSGVLYHFGARLHKDVEIPIGLINISRGGSAIEPWTTYSHRSNHLYEALIAPLHKQSIAGCIWFQGETDVMMKHGSSYFQRMKDLIEGWRGNWGEDMPFYYVHLTPSKAEGYAPGELPKVWEAQTQALSIPNTGMAVITDLAGDLGIHPKDHHGIGNRLALWALAKDYGKDIVYAGPLFKDIEIKGDKAYLSFAHAKGLKSRDGKALNEFKIVSAKGEVIPAQAEVKGETVVVSAEGFTPVAVQFGWHKTAQPNLVNGAGLPAAPFHTDNWKGATDLDTPANTP